MHQILYIKVICFVIVNFIHSIDLIWPNEWEAQKTTTNDERKNRKWKQTHTPKWESKSHKIQNMTKWNGRWKMRQCRRQKKTAKYSININEKVTKHLLHARVFAIILLRKSFLFLLFKSFLCVFFPSFSIYFSLHISFRVPFVVANESL